MSTSGLVETLAAALGALLVLAFVFRSFMALVPLADGAGSDPHDLPPDLAARERH